MAVVLIPTHCLVLVHVVAPCSEPVPCTPERSERENIVNATAECLIVNPHHPTFRTSNGSILTRTF